MRYGMSIDLRRCIGCDSCTVACKQHNGAPPGVFLSKVLKHETGDYPNARLQLQPMLCMHCNSPLCVKVCPTGASQQREDGIVTIDRDKCLGCRYCIIACPYNMRSFVQDIKPYYPEKGLTPYEKMRFSEQQVGVVVKCDFCADRLEESKEPACVQTCPAKARTFGDLDDMNSEVSRTLARRNSYQLLPALGTEPSVYYLP